MTICGLKDPYAQRLWGAGALYYHKNKMYYLFYSVIEQLPTGKAQSIGVATATSGPGPFKDHGVIVHGDADKENVPVTVTGKTGVPHGFQSREMAVNRLRLNGDRLAITPTIGINQPKPTW